MRLADEFDDLDLGLTAETPARPSRSRRVWPYAVLAIALALACAYLIRERYENATAIVRLTRQAERLEQHQDSILETQDEVGEALAELSEKSAAEAELHYGRGDRGGALADLDRAMHLLDLAQDLGKCACGGTTTKRVDRKLKEIVNLLQLTHEELSRLAQHEARDKRKRAPMPKQEVQPNSTRSGSPPPAETKPEPRGEPDA